MKGPEPVQPSLIVVSEASGHIHVPDMWAQPEMGAVVTDRISQKIHLLNTLGFLAAANSRAAFSTLSTDIHAGLYGERAQSVRTGAKRVAGELRTKADTSFKHAVGHYALLDASPDGEWLPAWSLKKQTAEMYSNFIKAYGLPRHADANRRYRKELASEIEVLTHHTELSFTELNRLSGHRPHKKSKQRSQAEPEKQSEVSEKLSSRARMEAILLDPRAGFLPKTHREKSRIISWLDYLDNPSKPLGLKHQLQEVYIRGENPTRKSKTKPGKHLGSSYGVRAVESIAWEVGDSLIEASKRIQAVKNLRIDARQDQRPSLSLYDAFLETTDESDSELESLFGENTKGLVAFVHYVDLLEYVKGSDKADPGRNPLAGRELPPLRERPKADDTPGRRKHTFSRYTEPALRTKVKAHIAARLKELTIKDLRFGIDDCLVDLEREYMFLDKRLDELEDFRAGAAKPRAVQAAVGQIRSELAEQAMVA